MRTAVDRAVPGGLLPDPNAVLDLGQDRATDRAVGAHVLPNDPFRGRRPEPSGFGFAQVAQRQRSERGQTTGSKPGAAQKRSAIDAAGVVAKRRNKGVASHLTFAFSDKHGLASP